jgi:hypothetical protein
MSDAVSSELQRTKLQLAELIDEVVYAENEKVKSEIELRHVTAKLDAIESCLQNFIAYTTNLEHSVLLPAVKELSRAIPNEALSQRAQAMAQLDALQNLSARTAKLIMSLKTPTPATLQRIQSRREDIIKSHAGADGGIVDLEQAYVLVALLLESKEELRVLIDDTVERVVDLRQGSKAMSTETVTDLSKAKERCATLERELASQKETITAIQSDREVLMARMQHVAPFKALQEQYHSERESLITRLRTSESECKIRREEVTVLQEALDATKKALDETTHERVILEDEMSSFRRAHMFDAVHGDHARGTTTLASSSMKTRNPRFWEDQAHRAQMDLEESERSHNTVVSRLEGQVAQLRMELSEAKERRYEHVDSAAQIDQLRRANAAMQEEIRVLQQHFLSSSTLPLPSPSPSGRGSSAFQLDERIETFETTIRSLHKELAHVEGKVQAVEDHYVAERQRMVSAFDDERRRAQQEREECDALVLRMGVEMEQLVKENDSLRTLLASS